VPSTCYKEWAKPHIDLPRCYSSCQIFAKISHQYLLWMLRYDVLKVGLQKVLYKRYDAKKKSCHLLDLNPQLLEHKESWVAIFRGKSLKFSLHLHLQLTLQSEWKHLQKLILLCSSLTIYINDCSISMSDCSIRVSRSFARRQRLPVSTTYV